MHQWCLGCLLPLPCIVVLSLSPSRPGGLFCFFTSGDAEGESVYVKEVRHMGNHHELSGVIGRLTPK